MKHWKQLLLDVTQKKILDEKYCKIHVEYFKSHLADVQNTGGT